LYQRSQLSAAIQAQGSGIYGAQAWDIKQVISGLHYKSIKQQFIAECFGEPVRSQSLAEVDKTLADLVLHNPEKVVRLAKKYTREAATIRSRKKLIRGM